MSLIHNICSGTGVGTHTDDVVLFNTGKEIDEEKEYDIFQD